MKTSIRILLGTLLTSLLINCPSSKAPSATDSLLPLLLLSGTSKTSTANSITASSASAVAGQSVSITINASAASTDSIMLSDNTTISSSDTTAVSNKSIASGTQTITFTIPVYPASPTPYYIGLLKGGTVTSTPVMILPAGSSVSVYSFNTLLTGVSLTNTVSRKYYEVDVVNGVNFVLSAYNVAGGLDVAVNVHTLNGSLTEVNARGSNNYERAGIDVTKSQKSWIEVRKNGASEGTFTFLAINKNITSSSSIAEGGGSCTGGTNAAIVNRCIDFDSNYTGKPASTADCVTLWGTGSVYAASCSTTNRIARCHANPASNNGRLTVNYYSTSDTTTSANTACNGDILTTP